MSTVMGQVASVSVEIPLVVEPGIGLGVRI